MREPVGEGLRETARISEEDGGNPANQRWAFSPNNAFFKKMNGTVDTLFGRPFAGHEEVPVTDVWLLECRGHLVKTEAKK